MKEMQDQKKKDVMEELRENAYVPPDQSDVITKCIGIAGEIDDSVTMQMPGTKWDASNPVAFADEDDNK